MSPDDIAKYVFHAHGVDGRGRAIFSKRITRRKLLDFFAAQPSCTVALEACGGAHHWPRLLIQLGHEVRLIPPAYVKPFVKRQKNDAIDAEAICEVAQRPSMRFVAVKSEQQQAAGLGTDAGSQTAHAGDRRACQQDGTDRLGATCKAGKLQSSGRSQGVSLVDLRSSQV
jgi:hypothetical protein